MKKLTLVLEMSYLAAILLASISGLIEFFGFMSLIALFWTYLSVKEVIALRKRNKAEIKALEERFEEIRKMRNER